LRFFCEFLCEIFGRLKWLPSIVLLLHQLGLTSAAFLDRKSDKRAFAQVTRIGPFNEAEFWFQPTVFRLSFPWQSNGTYSEEAIGDKYHAWVVRDGDG
jgi:hypothetical protein